MKKVSIFTLILLMSFSVFAKKNLIIPEEEHSWKSLQNAEQAFNTGDYSAAMKYSQNAIAKRKAELQKSLTILTNALKPYQVRKVGDYIPDVLTILDERQEYEAIQIIQSLLEKNGIDFFKSSIQNLTEYLQKSIEYPEAYFLLGKIYKLEGEYKIANDYFEKARVNSFLLEVPEQLTDILYEIADICDYLGDISSQEKALILIAQNDGDYKNETLKTSILRTSKSIKENNSSRFFILYRIEGMQTINAYYKLSKIYWDNKKYQESYLTNIYGVLISFTHINSLLEERESDYSYKDLKSFFTEIARYPDIVKWCNDTGFWQGIYNITNIGLKNNFERFPKDIIKELAEYCPEKYWKEAAQKKYSELTIIKNKVELLQN